MSRSKRMGLGRLATATVLVVGLAGGARAREGDADRGQPPRSATSEQVRFFESQVRPILKSRCLKCHGEGPKIRGGLRLDSRDAMLRGGDLGPAISREAPDQSLLLQAIRFEELEMPPSGKLPANEVEILERWVKDGKHGRQAQSRRTSQSSHQPGRPRSPLARPL